MAYNSTSDTGKYSNTNTQNSYYTNKSDLSDPASRAFVVTPAAAELTRYAKKLHIYVPAATASAAVSVVFLNDADNAAVVLNYTPGTYVVEGFFRRVTAVTGSNVVVTAFTD